MLQQHAFRYAWFCHDVIEHSFHHPLTHRFIQIPIYNPPWSPNEADLLAGPAKDDLSSALSGVTPLAVFPIIIISA